MKQIGPNVSISANARIGPGARLICCIILDDVEVMVGNWNEGFTGLDYYINQIFLRVVLWRDRLRYLKLDGMLVSIIRKMQLSFIQLSGGSLPLGDGPVSRQVVYPVIFSLDERPMYLLFSQYSFLQSVSRQCKKGRHHIRIMEFFPFLQSFSEIFSLSCSHLSDIIHLVVFITITRVCSLISLLSI